MSSAYTLNVGIFPTHGVRAATLRRRAFAKGLALQTHADAAHGGMVLGDCPACKEIAAKAAKLQ